jgi:hypothetical protein
MNSWTPLTEYPIHMILTMFTDTIFCSKYNFTIKPKNQTCSLYLQNKSLNTLTQRRTHYVANHCFEMQSDNKVSRTGTYISKSQGMYV